MKTLFALLLLLPLTLQGQLLRPGDANNDGRVNHIDVLAMGLSYGQEGPPRMPTAQGIDWSLKPFEFWPGGLPTTLINYGFSDCDGNGLVDEADMQALKLNYDSSHMDSQPPPQPYAPPDTAFLTALPRLTFTFDKDTATIKDTLLLSIFYEHPDNLPIPESPLGVAFTLEFDETLIKDSLTEISFEPLVDDLLFAAGATGFADARAVPPGMVEFGTAGKAQPALSFSRPLGVVKFIVADVIVRADTFWTELEIRVTKPIMINAREEIMEFEMKIGAVVLFQEISATNPPPEPLPVRLYPNPASERLTIESPEVPLATVQIFDAFGALLDSREAAWKSRVDLDVAAWPPGWYGVKITAQDGRTALQKFQKF